MLETKEYPDVWSIGIITPIYTQSGEVALVSSLTYS